MEVWFIDSYTDHSMCEDVVRFSVMDWLSFNVCISKWKRYSRTHAVIKSKADDLQIFYFKADYIYHIIYNVFIGYFLHGIFYCTCRQLIRQVI